MLWQALRAWAAACTLHGQRSSEIRQRNGRNSEPGEHPPELVSGDAHRYCVRNALGAAGSAFAGEGLESSGFGVALEILNFDVRATLGKLSGVNAWRNIRAHVRRYVVAGA